MAGRDGKREKEDLRQRRSKRYLSEALLGLMEERPLREISVVDICDRAMVHRTTFYAHFEDKLDLFRYVLDEMLKTAAQTRTEVTAAKGFRAGVLEEFRRGLDFFRRHKQFYLSGLAGGMGPEFRAVESTVARGIENLIREESLAGEDPQLARMAGAFYAGGILNLLGWWLENDMPVSEEELLETVGKLLPKDLDET